MDSRSQNIDYAAKGTCEWLLQHDTYKSWVTCDQDLLWIKGKPGSGKSTLLRYALDNVMVASNIGGNALVLSFFFHGRGAELQRTPLGLFRSLLHQLLSRVPSASPDLVATFQQRRNTIGAPGEKWQWYLRELQDFFRSSLLKVLENRSVWLFIDALDECGERNAVNLVRHFKTLLQELLSPDSQFRICFACRHYPILDRDFKFEICLEHENMQDISTYVMAQLSQSHRLTISMVPASITKRADGVFMWARLVVEDVLDLERQGTSLKKIENKVNAIPPELDELYDELVRNMREDDEQASLKLIQWICFATRPLSLDELRWAMTVDADCPHKSLRQCKDAEDYVHDSDTMEKRLKTLSHGLAEAVSSSSGRVVQFIHQSVKDFFVEKGLSTFGSNLKSAGTETDLVGIAHYRLSRTCIRYLAMEEIGQSTIVGDDLISEFPLLHYVTTSWVSHVKQSEERMVSQDDLLNYFAWPSETLLQLWVQVYGEMEPHSYDCPPEGTSMVHVASRYQLVGLLRVILQTTDPINVDINARDKHGRTALSWAAQNGREAAVKLLLETGKANVASKDKRGRTALSWAAERGRDAVVKLLLETGKADVESRDENGWTALWWAAQRGREAAVKLLLETGKADVDSKDEYGQAALLYAARSGHKAVVKLLLETGKADVDSKDPLGRTALLHAAEGGHEAVVKLLLETGKAGVDSKDFGGRTALFYAAKGGHDAVVKLLLETGKADVDSKDNYGRTALWSAAQRGRAGAVKLLLETGKADVDSKDNYGRTALSLADEGGYEDVVKLLQSSSSSQINHLRAHHLTA